MSEPIWAKINEQTYLNLNNVQKIYFPDDNKHIFYEFIGGSCKNDVSNRENIQKIKEYLDNNSNKF